MVYQKCFFPQKTLGVIGTSTRLTGSGATAEGDTAEKECNFIVVYPQMRLSL